MTTPDPDAYKSDWADLARRKWADYQRLVQRYEAGDHSVSTAIDLRETALAKLVPELATEIQRLQDADGLARDALRRSGYHYSSDSGKPLAELIERLNADARDVVRVCGEESKRLRSELEAMTALHDQKHRYWQESDNARQALLVERSNLRADLQADGLAGGDAS